MHRLSDCEYDGLTDRASSVAALEPESPAEQSEPAEETEVTTVRRSDTFAPPMELLGEAFPLVLCDARDPDEEEEEDDLDYLYDDEDEDLDDDLDEDLEEFEDEEEEFEDEDEEL